MCSTGFVIQLKSLAQTCKYFCCCPQFVVRKMFIHRLVLVGFADVCTSVRYYVLCAVS
jgi:hypothetical protein